MVKSLVKKDLFSHFTSPHFYICALILYLSTTFQFYIFNRFFVESFGSTSLNSFFTIIPYIFSLIIPVLVLQVSNSELENIFPAPSYKIILSKLISTTVVIAIMIVPLISVPVIVNIFGAVDFGQVIVAVIGILLYGILAVSVCLFLNELISSKPAFTAVSIVVLIAIDSVHVLSLYTQSEKFLSNVVNYISFMWHFDSFSKGIIDTRDVFYFLLTSLLFVILAYFANETKKGRKFFDAKQKKYSVLIIFIMLFAFLDNSRVYKRFDFTKDKQFSISRYTKDNLNAAEEPVRITYYRSKELLNRYPEVRDIYDYLKICAQENKNISLFVEDADKEENQSVLEKLNVYPQQIEIVNNNKTEYIKVYSAIVIEYLGNQKVLPFVLSTTSLEFELNLRFESLIKNKSRNVYLLCGNEYELNDYSYLQSLLEASDITTYALTKESLEYIIDQIELDSPLIIFGTSRLTPEQCSAIEDFILKGGKVFIATSKYSVSINGDWSVTKNNDDNFIPVLEAWGINFEDKLVNDISNIRISFMSSNSGNNPNEQTQYEYVNYPQWLAVLPQKEIPFGLSMFWASPISFTETVEPLFTSSDYSWTISEYEPRIIQETGKYFLSDPFTVNKTYIEDPLFTKEKSILAVKLKGPVTGFYNFKSIENPNVTVISDQYFAMNLLLELSSGGASDFRNLDFILKSILSLNNDNDLLKMQNAGFKNVLLYKITDLESFNNLKNISLLITFIVIPVIYLIVLSVIFIMRKKENEKYKY